MGRNFISFIEQKYSNCSIIRYDINSSPDDLKALCEDADLIFHFAAIQRPTGLQKYSDNVSFTKNLISLIEKSDNMCSIVFASSIQAELDNEYGSSKRKEEEMLIDFGRRRGNSVYVFRFPNMFGTMSKPNYTSVVSTFCYNISHNLPITINNTETVMKLAFVEKIIAFVFGVIDKDDRIDYPIYYEKVTSVSLAELVLIITSIKTNTYDKIGFVDSSFIRDLVLVYKWFEKVE